MLLAMCVGTPNTPRFGICPDEPSPLPSPMMSPPQSLVHGVHLVGERCAPEILIISNRDPFLF